ncbi:hypothetical protein HDU88_007931 [Geranomyces variabilis]|nr:hypothetical protein HDU88_007931 [Geranomyces variabilis]
MPSAPAPDHPFGTLTNLSCASVGTKVLFATDDFFSPAETFLSPAPPVFDPSTFTPFGKEMDGWETRRKRTLGHDWCLIKLGLPGSIAGFEIDTAFFTGNQTPGISVQAAELGEDLRLTRVGAIGSACSPAELEAAEKVGSERWEEVVPYTKLGPGYEEERYHFVTVDAAAVGKRFTHLRVNYWPDGGVARFRTFGLVSKDWKNVKPDQIVDLAHVENGGRAVSFSNAHYGHPRNLIAPGRSLTMAGGWETARNPDRPKTYVCDPVTGQLIIPGKHWAILELGHCGTVTSIEIDTHLFKGNFPESAIVEGAVITDAALAETNSDAVLWNTLVPRTKLGPHAQVNFDVSSTSPVTHIRVTMFPDGGISRVRVLGRISSSGVNVA